MNSVARLKEPLEDVEFALHRGLTHLLLIADLLFASRLYRVLGATLMQPLVLGLCAATIIFYCVYATARGRIVIPLIAIGYVVLIFNQLSVFAEKLWLPINTNAFFQFIWVLSFVPFAGICLSGGRTYLLRCVAGYGTFYCAFFAIASILQMAGALPGQVLEAIVSSDIERGQRVFLYAGLACFAYFYWLVQLRTRQTFWTVFFFGLCALASLLSLSRVYLLILFCLTIVFIFRPKPSAISIAGRILLFGGSAFVMSGLVYTHFNPFDLFAHDSSGSYRAMEYVLVRERLQMDPFWGFGLSPEPELSTALLRKFQVFPSDLGPVGVWFDFGLIGLVLYFLILWVCSRPPRSLPFEHGWPLFLTGSVMTAYGCISPLATSPGGATITGLILAVGFTARATQDNPRSGRNRIAHPVTGMRT
jgi:hypothetical protein